MMWQWGIWGGVRPAVTTTSDQQNIATKNNIRDEAKHVKDGQSLCFETDSGCVVARTVPVLWEVDSTFVVHGQHTAERVFVQLHSVHQLKPASQIVSNKPHPASQTEIDKANPQIGYWSQTSKSENDKLAPSRQTAVGKPDQCLYHKEMP